MRVCRDAEFNVSWHVTNLTHETLWVFVAPPSFHLQQSRANAFIEVGNGRVTLHKIQLTGPMAEPIMSGAIALEPGASDSGVIPLGQRLDAESTNFFPRSSTRQWPSDQRVATVTLEVGFMPRNPADRPVTPTEHQEFYLFMAIDRDRQELVQSPELLWR